MLLVGLTVCSLGSVYMLALQVKKVGKKISILRNKRAKDHAKRYLAWSENSIYSLESAFFLVHFMHSFKNLFDLLKPLLNGTS